MFIDLFSAFDFSKFANMVKHFKGKPQRIQLLEEVHADGKNGTDSMIAPLFTPSAPVQCVFNPFPPKEIS